MIVACTIVVLTYLIFPQSQAALPPWTDEVRRAMHDELRRSMDSLQLGSLKKPYYLEYTFRYRWITRAQASFGGIIDSSTSTSARVTVGIRIGSPEKDNTNFIDASLFFLGGSEEEEPYRNRLVACQPNYQLLRRELWLATDAAYKSALEQLAKKEAVLNSRLQRDTTPDYVLLPPAVLADTTDQIHTVQLAPLADHLRTLSAIARRYPALQTSTITFEHLPELIIYINSEGRQAIKVQRYAGIEIVATAQSSDGMPLAQTYTTYAPTLEQLPRWDSLARAFQHVAQMLTEQVSTSAVLEPYSGPVLFCGQAAAELVAQVFAPNLVAQRPPLSEAGIRQEERYTAFQNKLGARVMAEFLTLQSVPQKTSVNSIPIAATYRIDDEGVPPEPLILVRKGYLEQLLSSRVPTRRVRHSNGRMRGGGAMYDVLILSSEDTAHVVSDQGVIERMIEILKRRDLPYGYIVSELLNQNLLYTAVYKQTGGDFPIGEDGNIPVLAIERLWRNGRRERVRGLTIAGTSYLQFRDIVVVGTTMFVHNLLAPSVVSPYRTGGSQYVLATIVTPDLLFEDIELRPIEDGFLRPPLLSSPLE